MEIDFEPVFIMLNNELSKSGLLFELVCAGGYVLQRHGYRTTSDIDAFYSSDDNINKIIKKVGDAFGINKPDELWLNNSLLSLNPKPPEEYCTVIYKFSNLVVKEVSLNYLIGMKLFSQREQDIIDAAVILRKTQNDNPFILSAELKNMKFDIDIALLLEAYEKAYGMDWLENFYIDNIDELQKYF